MLGLRALPDDVNCETYERILVLGTTGSGKSRVSRMLLPLHGGPHIELDSLYHGPGWAPASTSDFQDAVRSIANGDVWIADGNYVYLVRTILWPRATLIVWLDLPLSTILPSLARRTVRRIVTKKELWAGNREGWSSLIGKDSNLRWSVRQHRHLRAELPRLLAPPHLHGVSVVRLRTKDESKRWLRELETAIGRDSPLSADKS